MYFLYKIHHRRGSVSASQAPRPSTPLHAPTPAAAPDPPCSSWRCYKEFYFSLLSNVQPKILVYFILLCVCMDVCMYKCAVMFFVTQNFLDHSRGRAVTRREEGTFHLHSLTRRHPAAGGGRRHEPGALRAGTRAGHLVPGPRRPGPPGVPREVRLLHTLCKIDRNCEYLSKNCK